MTVTYETTVVRAQDVRSDDRLQNHKDMVVTHTAIFATSYCEPSVTIHAALGPGVMELTVPANDLIAVSRKKETRVFKPGTVVKGRASGFFYVRGRLSDQWFKLIDTADDAKAHYMRALDDNEVDTNHLYELVVEPE